MKRIGKSVRKNLLKCLFVIGICTFLPTTGNPLVHEVFATDSVRINNTNFPDAIFLRYIQQNLDRNQDNYLDTDELSEIKVLDLTSLGIKNLKGIELFADYLEFLNCSGNQLTSLNVSMNTALEYLNCSDNLLTDLTVNGAASLETLICSNNRLTVLNVSRLTELRTLDCYQNRLTSLDLRSNPKLDYLGCADNQLLYVDVSNDSTKLSIAYRNNIYITNTDSINMANIRGFDMNKSSGWKNATQKGTVVTANDPSKQVTYEYKINDTQTATFAISSKPYFVTFKDGNSFNRTQTVYYGRAATSPLLTKTGYKLSWDKAFNRITKDITVNAKWTANKYNITYILGKGKNNTANPRTYTIADNKITLKDPTWKGYRFDGWYEDSSFKKKVTEIKKGSIGNRSIFAKWTINKFDVKFNANGGSVKKKKISVTYDSRYGDLPTPTKARSQFDGWYTKKKGGNKITSASKVQITKTQTLYARWKNITVEQTAIQNLKSLYRGNLQLSVKKLSGTYRYEVLYADNSKFNKANKLKITAGKDTSLDNLRSGKTYYLKARAHTKDSTGKPVYGKYSKVKKIKVK